MHYATPTYNVECGILTSAMSTRTRRAREFGPGSLPGLKAARLDAGYTQESLADAVGLSRLSVLRAELGYGVSLSTAARLADRLGVDVSEIMYPIENDAM